MEFLLIQLLEGIPMHDIRAHHDYSRSNCTAGIQVENNKWTLKGESEKYPGSRTCLKDQKL